MSLPVAIPYSGADGWEWMRDNRTKLQETVDGALPSLTQSDLLYFEQTIGEVSNAAGLLNNSRLLSVALGAFGLDRDPMSLGFLESVLERGTENEDALARDFGDARLVAFSKAFGFGPFTTAPKTQDANFGQSFVRDYKVRQLEKSVGATDPAMRRALAFDRVAKDLAEAGLAPGEGWARALADHSVRAVLSDALDLGPGFERLPLAKQAEIVQAEILRETGSVSVSVFAEESRRDAFIEAHLDASRDRARGIGALTAPIPASGAAGFAALSRGLDRSLEGFAAAGRRDPDIAYFARSMERIEAGAFTVTDAETGASRDATLAEVFVADARLRDLALEAFGLGDRSPTDAFLTQVLESDPADPSSFAASLDDPRWAEMARVFGFGSGGGAQIRRFGFADEIAGRLNLQRFEAAVGAQDADMRRALVMERTLEAVAAEGLESDEAWRSALANDTVRAALGTALGIEDAFATLGLGGQVEAAKGAARTLLGSDRFSDVATGFRAERLTEAFFREAGRDERPRGGLSQPTIPLEGLPGWRFLQRTLDTQRQSFAQSFEIRAEIEYFEARIATIDSAEALMADRRLRTVALTAFGLSGEIDKGAFMEKVLSEGTERRDALATKLSDPRFRELSQAFGFGDGRGAQTRVEGFAQRITARYVEFSFEAAVGEADESMRLALNFERLSVSILETGATDRTAWFRALGEPPMRRVIESAFNLPSEFSQIELDSQYEVVRERARATLGSADFSVFLDPAARETLIGRFFVGESLGAASSRSFSSALTLLQGAGAAGGLNQLL